VLASVLIADEPTRGVDVGSKRAIYDLLTEMAASGMGVVVISSDLEEVLDSPSSPRHAPRRIITELSGERMNEQAVLAAVYRVEQRRNGLIMNVQVETPRLDIDDGGTSGLRSG